MRGGVEGGHGREGSGAGLRLAGDEACIINVRGMDSGHFLL